MKTYFLSCNLEGHMHDNKCDIIVINKMPFNGLKEFYPLIHREALFFKEVGGSKIRWWHGWLKGFNLVPGIVKGYNVNFIYMGDGCWANIETTKLGSSPYASSQIEFNSVSIDIGGEELMIL